MISAWGLYDTLRLARCRSCRRPRSWRRDGSQLTCFVSCTQISANGRTTSLGDHETQEAAAAAFDRAAINKDGPAAKTNFDRDNYSAEMTVLTSAHLLNIIKKHVFALAVQNIYSRYTVFDMAS